MDILVLDYEILVYVGKGNIGKENQILEEERKYFQGIRKSNIGRGK